MKRDKDKTVKRIVQAALEIFAEKGFDGARMDDIAQVSGVNKATLYYHIGGKEKLYSTVMSEMLQGVTSKIIRKVNGESAPKDKLKKFIYELHRVKHRNPYFSPIMLRELASKGERLSLDIFKEIRGLIELFQEILTVGTEKGIFRSVNGFMLYTMVMGSSLVFHSIYPVFEQAVQSKVLSGDILPDYTPESSSEVIYQILIQILEDK